MENIVFQGSVQQMLSSILNVLIYMISDIQGAVQQGLLLRLYLLFFKFTFDIYIYKHLIYKMLSSILTAKKNFKIPSRSNAAKKMF